jgi:o-succinylbenzoate synthase
MPVTRWQLQPYRLPLRTPWVSSRGELRERTGWLLRLTDDSGTEGFGDCAPMEEMGTESAQQARQWLESTLPELTGQDAATTLERLPRAPTRPAGRCALEGALLDLLCKERGEPLRFHFSRECADSIRVNASSGAIDRLTLLPDWARVIKIKVGRLPPERELELLRRFARELPDDRQLRLDANRAWTPDQAEAFIGGLEDLPVESLEEPLASPTPNDLDRLQRQAKFDLALDESLPHFIGGQGMAGIPVRRIILKPTLTGGPVSCYDWAKKAAGRGIRCVVTSTLESASGTWINAQLAAAVDTLATPMAHGLATGEWFLRDTGKPPEIIGGAIRLPGLAGSGFRPSRSS